VRGGKKGKRGTLTESAQRKRKGRKKWKIHKKGEKRGKNAYLG